MVEPAVVDDDGVVAHLPVAAGDHHVRHLPEEVLADAELGVVVAVRVAAEPLPGQPAHGRGQGQAVVQTWPITQTLSSATRDLTFKQAL